LSPHPQRTRTKKVRPIITIFVRVQKEIWHCQKFTLQRVAHLLGSRESPQSLATT
jgi:hypothetical protein